MRLTLRTLLTHMDGLLTGDAQQEMETKISESEYASNLIHKIRDVTTRLRLPAPKLEGRAMGLDPNTMAEYLENTLASDKIPDFERVCLESDVHLAEVASCQQIVSMILGGPAQVDPESRRRMYRLLDPGHSNSGHNEDAVPDVQPQLPPMPPEVSPPEITPPDQNQNVAGAKGKPQDKPDVPDYLRGLPEKKSAVPDYLREGRKQRFWPMATLVALAAMVLVAIINFQDIRAFLGDGETVAQQGTSDSGDDKNNKENNETEDSEKSDPSFASEKLEDNQASTDIKPEDGNTSDSDNSKIVGPNVDPPDVKSLDPEGKNTSTDRLTSGKPPLAIDDQSDSKIADKKDGSVQDGVIGVAPGAKEELGRVSSATGEILFRLGAETKKWHRVRQNEPLFDGDRIVTPPMFRSKLTLASGIVLEIDSDTELQIRAAKDKEGAIRIDVRFGRILQIASEQPGGKIHLSFDGHQGILELAGDDSRAAVWIQRKFIAGSNPAIQPGTVRADFYALSGSCKWHEGGDEHTFGKLENHLSAYRGEITAEAIEKLPDWTVKNTVRNPIQNRAAKVFESKIEHGDAIDFTLNELAIHRRPEVQLLAIRTLAMLGQYKELLQGLEDTRVYASWHDYFLILKQSVARDPDQAQQIHAVLEKKYGKNSAKEMYRMLWGFSAEELPKGAAATLVGYLSHEELIYRVLAFESLRFITGMKLYFRPDNTIAQNRTHVQAWQKKLKDGRIVYAKGP